MSTISPPLKSTGGSAPRKSTGSTRPRPHFYDTLTFPDHASQPVISLIYTSAYLSHYPVSLQVYPLTPLLNPLAVAKKLQQLDLGLDHSNKSPRIDLYSAQGSIEECMAHQRAEKEYRKTLIGKGEAGKLQIIPTWRRSHPDFVYERMIHRNFIVVLGEGCVEWDSPDGILEKGVQMVVFDWAGTVADDVEDYEEVDEGDEEVVMVECMAPGPERIVRRGELRSCGDNGNGKVPGDDGVLDFGRFVGEMCFWLPECYCSQSCEDCSNMVEHERCTVKE